MGTSVPQPVGALIAFALVQQIEGLLPLSFAFAAGAMLALVFVAEEDFEVVAEAGDMEATAHYVRAHRPGVLVLDLNMPEGSSLPSIPTPRRALQDVVL